MSFYDMQAIKLCDQLIFAVRRTLLSISEKSQSSLKSVVLILVTAGIRLSNFIYNEII